MFRWPGPSATSSSKHGAPSTLRKLKRLVVGLSALLFVSGLVHFWRMTATDALIRGGHFSSSSGAVGGGSPRDGSVLPRSNRAPFQDAESCAQHDEGERLALVSRQADLLKKVADLQFQLDRRKDKKSAGDTPEPAGGSSLPSVPFATLGGAADGRSVGVVDIGVAGWVSEYSNHIGKRSWVLVVRDKWNLKGPEAESVEKMLAFADKHGLAALAPLNRVLTKPPRLERWCLRQEITAPWTITETAMNKPLAKESSCSECEVLSPPFLIKATALTQALSSASVHHPESGRFSLDGLFWHLKEKETGAVAFCPSFELQTHTPARPATQLEFDGGNVFAYAMDVRDILRAQGRGGGTAEPHGGGFPELARPAASTVAGGAQSIQPAFPREHSHFGCQWNHFAGERCPMEWFHTGWVMPPCCERQLAALVIETSQLMTQLGIRHWLACGTLIGALKIGRVLPWDNDGEIYIDERDRALMRDSRKAFRDIGIGCGPVSGYFWCHYLGKSKWYVEVGVHDEDVHPVATAAFYGVQLPVPRDARAYVAKRYGDDWMRNIPHRAYDRNYFECEKKPHSWNCLVRQNSVEPDADLDRRYSYKSNGGVEEGAGGAADLAALLEGLDHDHDHDGDCEHE